MEVAGTGNNGFSGKDHLEALLGECPNPVEKERLKISVDLGLDPCAVKFWFKTGRTQLKNETERSDNYTLVMEIKEKMKREIKAMQEAPEKEKVKRENKALKEALEKEKTKYENKVMKKALENVPRGRNRL